MLMPLAVLGVIMTVLTAPGLIAQHLADRKADNQPSGEAGA
ncbi:MAG: hypothetical protein AAGJ32_10860 [Pseudomonadota bacterium]